MIKLAIVGYGNLGKACERIICESDDLELTGIFTRRDPNTLTSPYGSHFFGQKDIFDFCGKIDVVALCTGSANDLTDTAVKIAKVFNTVDSFDTHARMCSYATDMRNIATSNDRLCFIGIGWDPGLFSLMRALFCGVCERGDTQTFWGRGVSQGHSEAIRRISGVENAKQYTIPKEDAIALSRTGKGKDLAPRDKHLRECFVVAKPDADKERIEREIKTMPNYFSEYDTVVHFIDAEVFEKEHSGMGHGGFVVRSGSCGGGKVNMELSLQLESNPQFTASVLMAYARANARMYEKGYRGVMDILDIPVSEIINGTWADKIKKFV